MLRVKGLLAGLSAAAIVVAFLPASASAELRVPYGSAALLQFGWGELFAPTAVAGANHRCKPDAEHPYPVVLVHGTAEDEGSNWVTLAPLLANHGYCVYAFNYGETGLSFGGRVDGLGEIAASAQQLSTFVERVLAKTGASQVDIVGHSQGGMMPNYYIKFLGGARKVHTLIGLAPSNHGTTVDGLVTLLNDVPDLGSIFTDIADLLGAPSLPEQEVGSAFETNLFAGGDTVPGPNYVVIETTHDEIVTPYTNAFLSGPDVTNITIQNQCPSDPSEHVGIVMDSPAAQDVLNELSSDPDPAFQPACNNFGPAL